jgi:site-specific DNA recombinase
VFDVVLVYKYDRFARKRRVYFHYIDELKDRYHVDVKSATESDDWLSVGFNGLMAEQYSRMLSARMTDVRRWEVTQLRLHCGRVPVGYSRTRGLLTPSAEASAIIRLGQLYARGDYSVIRLAETLNAEGYRMPDGAPFMQSAIKDMLHCPVYAGYLEYKGELFQGQHEPLWDAALWARIQEVLHQRSYTARRPNTDHQSLLTGIATCANCGSPMSHHPQASNPALRYYRCNASSRHQLSRLGLSCRARCSYADMIDAQVLAWLGGLALLPDLIERTLALVEQPRPVVDRAAIEERLKRLARAYGDGAYTEDEYIEKRNVLLDQVPAQDMTALDLSAGVALLHDLPALLAESTPAERRAIISQLVDQVYVRRHDVLALRPTAAATLFFQSADPEEWLTIVQNEVRTAPAL